MNNRNHCNPNDEQAELHAFSALFLGIAKQIRCFTWYKVWNFRGQNSSCCPNKTRAAELRASRVSAPRRWSRDRRSWSWSAGWLRHPGNRTAIGSKHVSWWCKKTCFSLRNKTSMCKRLKHDIWTNIRFLFLFFEVFHGFSLDIFKGLKHLFMPQLKKLRSQDPSGLWSRTRRWGAAAAGHFCPHRCGPPEATWTQELLEEKNCWFKVWTWC